VKDIFHFPMTSKQVLAPTHPFMQWVSRAVFPKLKQQGLNLTTLSHLLPKDKNGGVTTPFPHTFHGLTLD
jgi:hypothetical protein